MTGSDFPEAVKLEARRRAFFRCCYCHDEMGDDVHHLEPKEEGGQGVLDNAIFLCVRCHFLFGHRPEKRKQLRQARDHWYEVVADKYTRADLERLENVATKDDVQQIAADIRALANFVAARLEDGRFTTQEGVNVATTMVNSIAAPLHRIEPQPASTSSVGHAPIVVQTRRNQEDGNP